MNYFFKLHNYVEHGIYIKISDYLYTRNVFSKNFPFNYCSNSIQATNSYNKSK